MSENGNDWEMTGTMSTGLREESSRLVRACLVMNLGNSGFLLQLYTGTGSACICMYILYVYSCTGTVDLFERCSKYTAAVRQNPTTASFNATAKGLRVGEGSCPHGQ